jgi:flagellar hook-associated protein 3 FlgL
LLSATTTDFSTAEDIQVSFKEVDVIADGETTKVMQYSLNIGGKNVVTDETYDPKLGISYKDPVVADSATLNLKFDDISSGDSITLKPAQTINIFDSIQSAIDNAERPTSSPAAEANLQRVIDDLDSGFVHMNQQRSEVGTIMQQVDRQLEQHLDFELTLNQAQSGLEDLDYSKAIMDMNQQMMAQSWI